MHKLAIFVEGYTEILFMDRLITEIGGAHNVMIEHRQILGGGRTGRVPRTMTTIKAVIPDSGKRFFILLFDCGGDHQVKTRILQEHENLTRNGYSKIIGIRDVFPDFSYADIPKLELGLRTHIKTSLIPVEFVLSIMEIEAWFLAEHYHFQKIDSSITADEIQNILSFNPEHDDLSLRLAPRADLEAAYSIGGKTYVKGDDETINALDYPFMYIELSNKIPYLKCLGNSLDEFFNQA